jgi:hypothetical protein
MKSCLTTLFVLASLAALVGSAALIWHLSETAEFSRKPTVRAIPVTPAPVAPAAVPIAEPVR